MLASGDVSLLHIRTQKYFEGVLLIYLYNTLNRVTFILLMKHLCDLHLVQRVGIFALKLVAQIYSWILLGPLNRALSSAMRGPPKGYLQVCLLVCVCVNAAIIKADSWFCIQRLFLVVFGGTYALSGNKIKLKLASCNLYLTK